MKTAEEIENAGVDRCGRTLAHVFVGNISENKELLKLGMAWHYKYYYKDQELAKLEEKLKQLKLDFGHRQILLQLGILYLKDE